MLYAKVIDSQITDVANRPPTAARRLDTEEWVMALREASATLQEECGWFLVAEVPPPALAVGEVADMEIQLVEGRPTQVWTVRPETEGETSKRLQVTNRQTISDPVTLQTKIDELKSFLADPDVEFLNNLANNTMPTAQQLNRALKAMIRQQRREANATIRLFRALFGGSLLEDISDT
jgi:hypothetical protein